MNAKNVIVIGFVMGLVIGSAVNSASAVVISDIRTSNYSSSSVTISWITDTITDATVNYGTTTALGFSATDARPDDDTHWVQITGLSPRTTYFYEVASGGVTDNNGGSYYTFTTAAVGAGVSYTVYGRILKRDTITPATGTIVYVSVNSGAGTSHLLSVVSSSTGSWSVNLGNLKDPSTGNPFVYIVGDTINKFAQGAGDGTSSGIYTITGNSPQPLGDESLPVELSSFTATSSDDKVTLNWRTETEVNNIGFSIYRSEEKDGNYTKVNGSLIKGAGTDATPHDYSFTDENVVFGFTYYYYIEDMDFVGNTNRSHIIKVTVGQRSIKTHPRPLRFALMQNYPNPFNPDTWLPYELAKEAIVTIRIYDVKGQLVRQLDLGKQEAGSYLDKKKAAYWNGKDQTGKAVSSGLYFYTLKAGDFQSTKRMVIVK